MKNLTLKTSILLLSMTVLISCKKTLSSLIGGDAFAISYLIINENGKLVSSDPKFADTKVIRADFNAKIGEQFFTTCDGTDTDQKVTVTEKTDSKMSFSLITFTTLTSKAIHASLATSKNKVVPETGLG